MKRFFLLFCFLWVEFACGESSFGWDGNEEISQIFDANSHHVNYDKNVLFVSLGSNCVPAICLRELGLRAAAYPFDWLVTTSHEGLIKLFNEDFKYFLRADLFAPIASSEWITTGAAHALSVKNVPYGIYFFHEWPFKEKTRSPAKYKEQLERIKIKYMPRVERFKKLNDFPGKVFFVRTSSFNMQNNTFSFHHLTPSLVHQLKKALRRLFPKLDFTLVVMQYSQSEPLLIEPIDGVISFNLTSQTFSKEFDAEIRNILFSLFENYR